jgi:type I restriction enzyme R subunit
LSLIDLIVKTGIADAIAEKLGGMKGNKDAIAETIENNVRSKIIQEHLYNPAYFEKMSSLLKEIIEARKAKAIDYEEYLKRIAELAKRVEAGQAEDTPEQLNTPGRRALFDNLRQAPAGGAGTTSDNIPIWDRLDDEVLELTIKIDETVKANRPDGWRGVQARELVIKDALYGVLKDVAEVERIFLIIKHQKEY